MIPVKNLYHMLLYASDILPEKEPKNVDADEETDLLNLFAETLIKRLKSLITKGLYKQYISHEEDTSSIKGKILFKETVSKTTMIRARAYCRFDEFSDDILHNQIIKTTLEQLLRYPLLKKKNHVAVKQLIIHFHNINSIPLNNRIFNELVFHKNNERYKIIIQICKIIFENQMINEENGSISFINFDSIEKMYLLFENFVREFYKLHLKYEYDEIDRKRFGWNKLKMIKGNLSLVPKMETDITFIKKDTTVILDTKYYEKSLKQNYKYEDKINSDHLYQLFSYLSNTKQTKKMTGILLYPEVNIKLNEIFNIHDYTIKVCTINLYQHWSKIEEDLLKII